MSAPQVDRAAICANARAVQMRNAAIRSLDDPVRLARAARIVREALARNVLTLSDIDPAGGGPAGDGSDASFTLDAAPLDDERVVL